MRIKNNKLHSIIKKKYLFDKMDLFLIANA